MKEAEVRTFCMLPNCLEVYQYTPREHMTTRRNYAKEKGEMENRQKEVILNTWPLV